MAKVVTPSEIATTNPVGEPTIRKLGERRDLVGDLIAGIRRFVTRSRSGREGASREAGPV
jgi:hypothetical protein